MWARHEQVISHEQGMNKYISHEHWTSHVQVMNKLRNNLGSFCEPHEQFMKISWKRCQLVVNKLWGVLKIEWTIHEHVVHRTWTIELVLSHKQDKNK